MIATEPTRATRVSFVVACLATLALAFAACGSANPSAGLNASVSSSTGPEPSASQARSVIPAVSASPARATSPARTASPTPSASESAPAPLPTAAHQPQTIHIFDYPTGGTDVRVGSLTGCTDTTCQGDYIVGYDRVVDAATGREVGTLAYECFLVDPGSTLYHCPGNTFTLTGRGQIVFAEVIQPEAGGPPTTGPITGGTGEFLGATGFVVSQKISNGGDFVVTITG